jgi:hypothetical protein
LEGIRTYPGYLGRNGKAGSLLSYRIANKGFPILRVEVAVNGFVIWIACAVCLKFQNVDAFTAGAIQGLITVLLYSIFYYVSRVI